MRYPSPLSPYPQRWSSWSGRELWIGSCFPSVVVRARVSRLTATRFSANRDILR